MNETHLRFLLPPERQLPVHRRRQLLEAVTRRIDGQGARLPGRAHRLGHRRRVAMLVGAAGSLLAAGTVAAATGLWSGPPAPAAAQREVAALERVFGQAHQDTAIELARSGDHVLYGARTAGGGYCLSVGTGGGVGQCTVPAASPDLEDPTWFGTEGRLDPRGADDPTYRDAYGGGSVFGRAATADAATVQIGLPGDAPAAVATVGPNGFFVVGLPEAAWRAQLAGAEIGPATVLDAVGDVIAVFDSAGKVTLADGSAPSGKEHDD